MPVKNWSQGEHDFLLKIGNIRAIEQSRGVGIMRVAKLIETSDNYADDILETIRQGLIGGGMPSGDAGKLALNAVETRPLEASILAQSIFNDWFIGEADIDLGKPIAGDDETPPSE